MADSCIVCGGVTCAMADSCIVCGGVTCSMADSNSWRKPAAAKQGFVFIIDSSKPDQDSFYHMIFNNCECSGRNKSQGLISLLAHPLVKYCQFGTSPVNHSDSDKQTAYK